jgi:hypothetical protein
LRAQTEKVQPFDARRQAAAPELPVHVQRRATHVLERPQRRIDIRQPIERVVARWCVVQIGGYGRPLAIDGTQRGCDASDDLRVAAWPLPRVVD